MYSRWSPDSSTNDTTAESPGRLGRQLGQPRVVEAHRDFGREVLQQVAGQPQLREHDESGAIGSRRGQQRVVARQVVVQAAEVGGDLGERDGERLHAPEHTRRSGARAVTFVPATRAGGRC